MDFERILRQWESREQRRKRSEAQEPKRRELESLIDRYPPRLEEAESDSEDKERQAREQRAAGRRLPVEAELDLHGYTIEQAARALEIFIADAYDAGMKKVLVIHGKGKHSSDKAVLPEFVRSFLQAHDAVGEIGTPKRTEGGTGATWAIVRGYRSR